MWVLAYYNVGGFRTVVKKCLCFHTRKPSFSQGFSDDTNLTKSRSIHHFSAVIYLSLTATLRTQRAWFAETYPPAEP